MEVSSFTIISCANSIIRSGAIPVLVDSDINNFNIKVENIESVISPKTVAIMAVHIYGLPVDMNPIIKLAEKYNLAIIEDAAELIGGEYKGLPCGSFGTVSTFSFYPNKHITTGEGGMVLTNDRSIAERCRSLRNLGFQPHNRFVHNEIGWNYRMTNIQAALGIAQLERLDHSINKKIWIGKTYMEKLSDLKYIQLPIKETNYAKNIFWVFGILVEEDFGFAKNIMLDLAKRNIGTRPFFYPMHLQPIFNKLGLFKNVNCPNSEKLYRQGFYIPSGLNLNIEDIDYVVEQLKTILD